MTLKQAHSERRQENLACYVLKAAVPLTNKFKFDEFLGRKTEFFFRTNQNFTRESVLTFSKSFAPLLSICRQ